MSGVFIQEINQRFSSVSEFESVSSAQPIVPQSFPSPQDALGSGNLQDSFTFGSEKISGHFRSQHFHGRKGFSNYSNFLHLLGSSLGQDPSTSGWVRPPGEGSSDSGWKSDINKPIFACGWARSSG